MRWFLVLALSLCVCPLVGCDDDDDVGNSQVDPDNLDGAVDGAADMTVDAIADTAVMDATICYDAMAEDAAPHDAGQRCVDGELRRHTCPDGALVPWCDCADDVWRCIDSPESACRDAHCDDGAPAICISIPPTCQPGEILAAQNECWICVDPATCQPTNMPPPLACATDADCAADAFCDGCATSSCPNCDDCVAGCSPHNCPTDAELEVCEMVRPDCEPTQVAVVRDSCWVCVDRTTCEPPNVEPTQCSTQGGICEHWEAVCPEGFVGAFTMDCPLGRSGQCCLPPAVERCYDPGVITCAEAPPACDEFSMLVSYNGCWSCVNAATCHPWGQPGCRADDDCADGEFCSACGTSSCPICDDCVPACRPQRE